MGTSLSGLTPATTFDGLLKTSDNEPLDGTLKAISTGEGTDTILSLSNSALKIGGATTIDVGNGHPTADDGLYLGDGGKLKLSNYFQEGIVNVPAGRLRLITSQGVGIGTNYANTTAANTTLSVKGSGATSATTSLLVQNSAGTDYLKVTDDGNVQLGSSISVQSTGISAYNSIQLKTFIGGGVYESGLVLTGNGAPSKVGIGETTPTAKLHVKGSGNDNTTTSLLVQNSDGDDMLKVTDDGITTLGTTGQRGQINLKRPSDGVVIGTIQGTSNGLYLTNQDGSNHILIGTTSTNGVSVGGGTAPTMGARFGVKGSGTTSATTSLLVQNSAGTDLFKVEDGGTVRANSIKGINYQNNHLSLGANAEFLNFSQVSVPKIGINALVPTGTQAVIKGSGNDATTTALLVQNSDGDDMLKVTDDGAATIQSNFGASGGDVAVFQNNADPTNQFKINKRDDSTNIWHTGTVNTEIQYRDNIHFRFNLGGVTQMQLRNSGNLGLGVGSSNASARMHIKGSGTTSATTALLVQNVLGADLMKVRDDGASYFYGQLNTTGAITNGTLLMNSSRFQIGSTANGALNFSNNGLAYQDDNVPTQDASAAFQVNSTARGFLPPRMTTTERDAISTPAAGLMVYNTTTNKAQCYNGSTWNDLF